ncbi:hypothetical protein QVD99_005988 [Batrachochytrium dendrobatidis]|nr:hypothetical protein O5D80_006176 [Batrachochytrium dendrobatidis]KAK5667384.1 hypothetical protein QVD99_005988 [Batrachochytrium dendrobatidis]OAJ42227.1 hypothetical protein BDEG_25712 [Batrachochytrium dendrobatidis JEL423]
MIFRMHMLAHRHSAQRIKIPTGIMRLQSRQLLTSNQSEKYCMDLVRTHDYEQFLITLFTPEFARQTVWALKAFNVETAIIRDAVTDVNIGSMRIQWWRDAIEKTFQGSAPNHPVMMALAKSLESTRLSRMWFTKILAAREANLRDTQHTTIADLEAYSENTMSSLIYLHLEALGVTDVNAEHAASHSGKAIGITTALRSTPFNISKQRFYLPTEIMAQHQVVTEDIFRFGSNEHLLDAVFTIATRANDQILTARSFSKDVPITAIPALLPLILGDNYLTNLQKANFNVFDPSLQKKSLFLQFYIWNLARKNKY